ncbi:MAG TPA: zf-HC2 domain-containing protein [Mucilaginibacter sp.]|nr:zf-HC2 domain-containing protein [Mucilaginibacter sp.]
MKCEDCEMLFAGWINKELTAVELADVERHLAGCESCAAELAAMKQLWTEMDGLTAPEPPANMKADFMSMLEDFKMTEVSKGNLSTERVGMFGWIGRWRHQWPLGFQLAIVLISFGCGYLFFTLAGGGRQDRQMAALTSQVHELKQTMMLALLENPSASERIKGVSYTSQIKHADQEVIDALLATLNNDPNVNVRLSTLDALTRLANHPEVRLGLVQSITTQKSPLMQSAIADVMLKLQEKSSVRSLRELLKQKNLDEGVRDKIKQTITQLI